MKKQNIVLMAILVFSMMLLCSCGGGFQFRPDVAMESIDRNNQLKYFTEYTDTDETINVTDGSINPGYSYKGDSFEYEGSVYKLIVPKAVYKDGHRKDAVANLYDGKNKMTAYNYDYPEGLQIMNVSDFLYCKEDDLTGLYEFYNDPKACAFTYKYVYLVPDKKGKMIVETFEDVDFDNDTFIKLSNGDSSVCDKVDRVERKSKQLSIRQYSVETNITRTLEFYRTDGKLYMHIFNDMLKDGGKTDVYDCYQIKDANVIKSVNDKMDDCNRIIKEDYSHKEDEY